MRVTLKENMDEGEGVEENSRRDGVDRRGEQIYDFAIKITMRKSK